jgi:hypothetical protein
MGLPDLYPLDSFGLSTTIHTGGWDLMGLITGTAPDLFSWQKWKLKWIDDNQVNCVTTTSSTRHFLSPLSLSGGIKMIALKLNDTSVLTIELRAKQGLDRDACSEGLLFYIVNVAKASGHGPIHVIDPRGLPTAGCNPSRGGPLTSAAMDYNKGERVISLPQYGVHVQVEAKLGPYYRLLVKFDGEQPRWRQT